MKFIVIVFAIFGAAFAYEQPLENGQQEKLAQEIFHIVRCVVCDGESLSSSAADFSVDMRALIREQVQSGKSEEQILQYLVERYGEQILQAPPKRGLSLFLWFFPLLILLFGATKILRKNEN